MAVQMYMTQTQARQWARHYSENPSWYWDAPRRSHVLIADGVTTPGDMGVEVAAGRGDPAAVADYFVMAAQLLSVQAAFAVDAARQRDSDEETFDSQAALAAAEAHQAATQAQLADLQRTAEGLHYTAEVERVAAEEALDDRMVELVARNDEVFRVYHLIFDREHYASFCEGDGAAEDNYSDQNWEAAEKLVDSGRTAESIKASREAAASAYPEPTPDEGKGAHGLWARLHAAPPEVQEEFWLVHPRPGDPDITEAMLAGAYAAVGIRGQDMTEAEFMAQSRNPEDVADDHGPRAGTSDAPAAEQAAPHVGDVAAGTSADDVLAELVADRAQLTAGEAEDLANAERAQAAWEYEGDQRRLWEELGASPPEVRAAFWGARDAAGPHAGHAMNPAELGAAFLDARLPVPEHLRPVAAEDSDTAADRAVMAQVEASEVAAAADHADGAGEGRAEPAADAWPRHDWTDDDGNHWWCVGSADAAAETDGVGCDHSDHAYEAELEAAGERAMWTALQEAPDAVRAQFWAAQQSRQGGPAISWSLINGAYEEVRKAEIHEHSEADDPHDHAFHHDGGEDLPPVAAQYPGNPDAYRCGRASTVVPALPGSWDAAVPGISARQSADSVLTAVLDELDQARARLEAGDVPPEREREQAEYIEYLQDQAQHAADVAAGKSADDVLTELIAELDATAPNPYPGDEAYGADAERSAAMSPADQLDHLASTVPVEETLPGRDLAAAQILHDALYDEGPPVAAEQAAGFAAYTEMWAQEALAEYDRDLDERAERDQSAQGGTPGYPADEERSPGQPACAQAVAAAHEAVRADAQRVTEQLDQPARAHADGRQHGPASGQQSATHEGGHSDE